MGSGGEGLSDKATSRVVQSDDSKIKVADTDGTAINAATEEKQDDIITELQPVDDTPISFEDTSFETGDSPVTLDINSSGGLGREGTQGWIKNDGPGNFTVSFSNDGVSFGNEHTMKRNEVIRFSGIVVDSLRITWIADSAYRVSVI